MATFLTAGILAAGMAADAAAQPVAELLPTPQVQLPTWKLMGVASCGSAGCHGAAHPQQIVGSEYNVWISADPHSRAYSTLFNEQSQKIVRLLNGAHSDSTVAAHEDARCLSCHSMTHAPPARLDHDVFSDGVSCEACHGPAQGWLAEHYKESFRHINAEHRERVYGFWNTKSLVRRSEICASCHVGSLGRDVNHDLIAAGHPRLQFEMGAYSTAMPRHWDDAKDRQPWGDQYDAILWAVGQLCTSQAALQQLTARAESQSPWPEFAEWSCAACHHDLRDSQQRQQQLAKVDGLSGKRIAWDDWNHHATRNYLGDLAVVLEGDRPLVSSIAQEFVALNGEMRSITADRRKVARMARHVGMQLNQFALQVESSRWTSQANDRLSSRIANRHINEVVWRWSSAAQAYDALASLHQSRLNRRSSGTAQLTGVLSHLYDGLAERQLSPAGYQFDADLVARQLLEVQRALPAPEDNQ